MFYALAVLSLLLLLPLLLGCEPSQQPEHIPPADNEAAREQAFQQAANTYEEAQQSDNPTALSKAREEIKALLPPRLFAQWDLSERRQAKADFYAQVVDQHGEPVAGARINVVGANQNWYTSDAQGLFRVKGRSESIRIDLVQHPQLSEFKHRRGGGVTFTCTPLIAPTAATVTGEITPVPIKPLY